MFYDKAFRLAASQNARQKTDTLFSYTRYDYKGRGIESGVGKASSNSPPSKTLLSSTQHPNNWLTNKKEVVKTLYDLPYQNNTWQKHLRNRVSAMQRDEDNNGQSEQVYVYSYDVLGNVSELRTYTSSLQKYGHQWKQVLYEYDLISGKVTRVTYQPNQPDQMIHRYIYDADNRLVAVWTSRDGIEYTMEGKYYYYPHGPLMRIEYGQHQVQGLDYAYTIQGWLKAINGTNGGSKPDMGKDGYSGYHSLFSKDALGVVLNYYEGDYDAVDYVMWNSANSRYISYEQGSSWKQWRRNMYNGNISGMSSSIGYPDTMMNGVLVGIRYAPLGNGYYYDQLNRLVQMRSFNNIDTVNNEWKSGGVVIGDLYRQRFEYDRNGNIEMQVRCDSIGNKIDSLVYHYERNGGKKQRNRLMHVNDKVGVTVIGDDIEDEGVYDSLNMNNNNYIYDRIGNLIMDKKEQLEIRWNLQNKVQYVKKQHTGNTYTEIFFEYDAMGNRVSKSIVQHTVSGSIDNSTTARTYYMRDAQGNVIAVYEQKLQGNTMSIKQAETHIYGTQRLGISYPSIEMIGNSGLHTDSTKYYYGHKDYELTNHLGNVLATVSDRKIPVDKDNDAIIDNYVADITSVSDYYPFGSSLYGRRWSAKYRYGFNDKENINEVYGIGNFQDYGARMYDTRLGRFISADPIIVMQHKYQDLSPYQFASNTPIWGLDWDGKEVRIYTETTGLTGHTFLSVGSGDDIIVYSYGRYDDIGKPSMGRLSPTGEGVLIRFTGQKAKEFMNISINKHGAKVYELTDIDKAGEEKVKNFFDKKFNSSNELPDNPKSNHYQDPDARVIDEYNLLNNNCTTKSCEAAEAGGTKAFNDYDYIIPLKPENATPIEIPAKKSFFMLTPAGLQQYLDYKSNQKGSPVKEVTKEVSKEVTKDNKNKK